MALVTRLDPWAPPIALMAVIFLLSAQPDLNSGLGTFDLIGRKFIHAAEYALLVFLWWRALRTVTDPTRAAIGAFLITVAYAASDEFHQTFVSGRSGKPLDVLIDSAGAAIAAALLARRD
ncbi:MAG: VanZ family protein [Thermoleophilaceae bacterium]|nr:VanZ family protein [Thermoleophilaceae bacterium]